MERVYDACDVLVAEICCTQILVQENDKPVRPLEYAMILYHGTVVQFDGRTWMFSLASENNLLDGFWTNEVGERVSLLSFLIKVYHSGTYCRVVRFPWQ